MRLVCAMSAVLFAIALSPTVSFGQGSSGQPQGGSSVFVGTAISTPQRYQFQKDKLNVWAFCVLSDGTLGSLDNILKALAGLKPTPPPGSPTTLAALLGNWSLLFTFAGAFDALLDTGSLPKGAAYCVYAKFKKNDNINIDTAATGTSFFGLIPALENVPDYTVTNAYLRRYTSEGVAEGYNANVYCRSSICLVASTARTSPDMIAASICIEAGPAHSQPSQSLVISFGQIEKKNYADAVRPIPPDSDLDTLAAGPDGVYQVSSLPCAQRKDSGKVDTANPRDQFSFKAPVPSIERWDFVKK
jgi:hypothetical protein